MKEMSCVYIYIYIVIACILKTVTIFSATYTPQQLGGSLRNKQKNEKTSYRTRLVTSVRLYLAQPNSAPTPALQQYTCIWSTPFVPRHLTLYVSMAVVEKILEYCYTCNTFISFFG
jgi:hypothetical protein